MTSEKRSRTARANGARSRGPFAMEPPPSRCRTPAQTCAVFWAPDISEKIELVQRYQRRLKNMYNRALRTLLLLRKVRPPTAVCEGPGAFVPVPNEPKTSQCLHHGAGSRGRPAAVPIPTGAPCLR